MASATSFPLSKHTRGGDTAPAFSGLHVYLQFTWEVGLPHLLWSFLPTATFTSFPASDCWACAAAPAFFSWLVVRDFPSPQLRRSGHPALFAPCLICSYCLLFRFFFFPWMGVGLSRGLCWSGPGLSVGVPRAAYLTLWSESSQAVWALLSGSPSALLVLRLTWSGDAICRLEVWRSQSFASSRWFFL
jgi:hypothetical protein